MKTESAVISFNWWSMSVSLTNCEAFLFIPPQFSQRWSWHINTYRLAGWLIEKQERVRANTGFSVSTATPSLHSSFQHGTSLHLTMATAVCVCACVCVCVCVRWISWFLSHHQSSWLEARSDGFSISSEWSARHWKQWSHWTQWFQGGSGREAALPSICLSLAVCADLPGQWKSVKKWVLEIQSTMGTSLPMGEKYSQNCATAGSYFFLCFFLSWFPLKDVVWLCPKVTKSTSRHH